MSNVNRKLHDLTIIKVCCRQLGIGNQSQTYNEFFQALTKVSKDINFSKDDRKLLTELTKNAFPSKEWDKETIDVEIIDQDEWNEWPEFQIQYKSAGVIAYYNLNENNPQNFKELYQNFKKDLNEKRQQLMRVFFIGIKENQLKNILPFYEELFVTIQENSDIDQIKKEFQQIIFDIIVNFSIDIKRIQTDPDLIILFNKKEEKIQDQAKLKKRKIGRGYKVMGDYSLMINSSIDASNYFYKSLEILKKNDDFLWTAAAIEGQCASLYIKYCKLPPIDYNIFMYEALTRLKEAINFYQKSKILQFEIECRFKLLHSLYISKDKINFNEVAKQSLEYFQELRFDEKEIAKFYIKIAQFYKELGFKRKYAYMLKNAAEQSKKQNVLVSQKLMLLACPVYKLYPFNFLDFSPNFNKNNNKNKDNQINTQNNEIQETQQKSQFFWYSLQLSFLSDFLMLLEQDPQYSKQHILQLFMTKLDQNYEKQIYDLLKNESPFLDLIEFQDLSKLPILLRINVTPSDQLVKVNELQQVAQKSLFIYEPWKQKSQKLKFSQGQLIKMVIIFANPFNFPIDIDMIVLCTEGVEVLNYPQSSLISASKQYHEISIYIKPFQQGKLKIKSVKIKAFNTFYEHLIDFNGNGINYIQYYGEMLTKFQNYDLYDIDILENLPNLDIHLIGEISKEGELIFEISQNLRFQIELYNESETEAKYLKLRVCLEFSNPPIQEFEYQYEELNIKLKPKQFANIILVENELQIDQEIKDINRIIKLLPKLKHETSKVNMVTFTFNYMSDMSAQFIKEKQIQKKIKINETIYFAQLKLYEQNEFDSQNNYAITTLSDFYYIFVSIEKTDLSAQYKLTFNYDNKLLEKIDMNLSNRVTQLFKLNKLQLILENNEEKEKQKIFKQLFQVSWYSPNKFTQGKLDTKLNNPQQFEKILKVPIKINIKYFKIENNQQQEINQEQLQDQKDIILNKNQNLKLRIIFQFDLQNIKTNSVECILRIIDPLQIDVLNQQQRIILNGKSQFKIKIAKEQIEKELEVYFDKSLEISAFTAITLTDHENKRVYHYQNIYQIISIIN